MKNSSSQELDSDGCSTYIIETLCDGGTRILFSGNFYSAPAYALITDLIRGIHTTTKKLVRDRRKNFDSSRIENHSF